MSDSSDCDDAAATIYPNAPEYCNEIDDDCDEETDDHALDKETYYADTDGDGFGDATELLYACPLNQPTETVANSNDCDDALASVYPDAPEYCNERDDDCDGGIDEGQDFEAPQDAGIWYYDLDGDGYGNPANTVWPRSTDRSGGQRSGLQ